MSKEDFSKGHDGSDNYDNVAVVETGSGRSDMRDSDFMTRNGLNLESFKPRESLRRLRIPCGVHGGSQNTANRDFPLTFFQEALALSSLTVP
jgi:hypothetical protein